MENNDSSAEENSCTRSGASEQSALISSSQSKDSLLTAKPEDSGPKKPEAEATSLLQGNFAFNKTETDEKKNEKLPIKRTPMKAESANEEPICGQCANSKPEYDEDEKNNCIIEGSVLKPPAQEQAPPAFSNMSVLKNGGGDTFDEDKKEGEFREQSTNITQSPKPTEHVSIITKPIAAQNARHVEEDHLDSKPAKENDDSSDETKSFTGCSKSGASKQLALMSSVQPKENLLKGMPDNSFCTNVNVTQSMFDKNDGDKSTSKPSTQQSDGIWNSFKSFCYRADPRTWGRSQVSLTLLDNGTNDKAVIKEWIKMLKKCNPKVNCDIHVCHSPPNDNKPLLIVCFHSSRLPTDAKSAIKNVQLSDHKHTALLVFHHSDVHALDFPSSKMTLTGPQFKDLTIIVDFAFFENKGIYDCYVNRQSWDEVIEFINSLKDK